MALMADAIEANLGKKPTQLSADAGYCCDANLTAMEEREIDAYIAPGRAKHAGEERRRRPRRRHARKNQGRRALQPLPLKESSCPSQCSDRSSRRAASVSFSCAASRGRERAGASSASPTIS